jgi:hypothetical protein
MSSFSFFQGKFTPRLEWHNIVYQRACWNLEQNDLMFLFKVSGFELFFECFLLKKRLSLPDCVFIRVPQEVKPLFLDFRNFFLLEILQHISRSSSSMRLTEFAPDEEELWFEIEGEKYCCEIRTGMYFVVEGEEK